MADNPKQIVKICSYCQKEQGIEKEMKDAAKVGIIFTHGYCIRHFKEQLKDVGLDDATIRTMVAKSLSANPMPPDLAEHPDLIKLYKQGIWLPQQLQQSQPLKESTDLKTRFRKLAGIK
jgi:hypothetical protein